MQKRHNMSVIFESTDGFATEDDANVESLTRKVKDGIRAYFKKPVNDVFSGKHIKELPNKKIRGISGEDGSAFCFPEDCFQNIHGRICGSLEDASQMDILNKIKWNPRKDYAYGMMLSLYERDALSDLTTGEPIADCLCAVTKENCCVLALADGVSWGEKAKLAATCSVYGSITHLIHKLDMTVTDTRGVFRCILQGFEQAQQCIVDHGGAMTTLCVAVVVELVKKPFWGVCVVNVGDTYAYVYSEKTGVREVTSGSHSLEVARDMRVSGGALGPADGYNPDLSNLTCSFTRVEQGDIVYVCSDGISDNFDPTVAKRLPSCNKNPKDEYMVVCDGMSSDGSVPKPYVDKDFLSVGSEYANLQSIVPGVADVDGEHGVLFAESSVSCGTNVNLSGISHAFAERSTEPIGLENGCLKPLSDSHGLSLSLLTPAMRQQASLEHMTEVIRSEHSHIPKPKASAIGVCAQLLNYVVRVTADRREVLEAVPQTMLNQLDVQERRKRLHDLKVKLKGVPGKLDHASIVAYEVGWHAVEPARCETPRCDLEDGTTVDSSVERVAVETPVPQSSLDSNASPSQVDSRQFFFYK